VAVAGGGALPHSKRAIMNSAIVKRSVSLGGHKTSISLEDAFWNYLKEIAESRGVSVSVIVAEIQAQDRRTNLSSAIRLYVLEHACERCAVAEGREVPQVRPEMTATA
jgi:predicted DNA-binding ribbon-helix-helix protein